MTDTSEPNNVREAEITSALAGKEQKERERRRKKYKFALVKWLDYEDDCYAVEYKMVLGYDWYRNHVVICDDQPEKVLRAMLRMLKEG